MKTITLIMLLFCSAARAQFIEKKDIAVYACMFGAGAFYGEAEQLIWHNPHPGDKFWDPYRSWETKHTLINADAYHIARAGQYICITAAVIVSVNDFKGPGKFWKISKKILLCSASFQAGMLTTYHQ